MPNVPAGATCEADAGTVADVDESPAARLRSGAMQFYRRWLLMIALILGTILRTREWLYSKSLWLDELTLTTNLVSRDFAGLTRRLDGNQGAPVLWLWAEKISINVFGVSELSLRLVPWLASLIALAVFPFVARRLIGEAAAPAAVVLFATAPSLIYYAAETKQYSSDVASMLLVVLATTLLSRREPTLPAALYWGAACGALVWFSQPAIVVSAACGLFLAWRSWRSGRILARLLGGGAILGASVALQWWLVLGDLKQNSTLRAYWQAAQGFPPSPPTVGGHIAWLRTFATAFFDGVGHFAFPWLALELAVWGFLVMLRRRPWSAAMIGLVVAASVGAALAYQYPLAQRLALFLLPMALLLVCAGLGDASFDAREEPLAAWRQVAVALCALFLFVVAGPAIGSGLGKLIQPDETTATRQAIEFVAAHREPGDLVLVEAGAESAADFYGPRLNVRADGVFRFERPTATNPCTGDRLAPLAGAPRVWLVFGHHFTIEPANRTSVYLSQVAAAATQVTSFTGAGDAGAFLFDLGQPPATPQEALKPWIPRACLTISR